MPQKDKSANLLVKIGTKVMKVGGKTFLSVSGMPCTFDHADWKHWLADLEHLEP